MKNKLINLAAFSILSLLWLIFLIALFINQQTLIAAWQVFSTWPLVIQIVVALLALPVIAGLWIWQTTWALALRIILVLGLAFVTVYLFFPRKRTR
jgi:hypothetical protein